MKRLLFVDHSYHAKTKSTDFILELLSERYNIDIVYDSSWLGEPEIELQELSGHYDVIVFWQVISKTMIRDLRCNNIVFFPMYDACVGVSSNYWFPLKGLKVVNFSRTLDEELRELGFHTLYVQYYPLPGEFVESNERSVFFWQRRDEITWWHVKQLFPPNNTDCVHIHRTTDPGHEFLAPSLHDEGTYKITYSDWFEHRKDYVDAVTNKSFFIAPRPTEGIGFSFLEAMSIGKIVVGVDRPTMNEYIIHGVNGLLFSLENPQPLHVENLERLMKAAHESIVQGRLRWESDRQKILDFIETIPSNDFVKRRNYSIIPILLIVSLKVKNILKYVVPYGIVMLFKSKFSKRKQKPN